MTEEKVVYQIQGSLEWDDRPNIEILFEDDDLELVEKVYLYWQNYLEKSNDVNVPPKTISEWIDFLNEQGIMILDRRDEEYLFNGIYEVKQKRR